MSLLDVAHSPVSLRHSVTELWVKLLGAPSKTPENLVLCLYL